MAETELARAEAIERLLDHRRTALDALPHETVGLDALAGRTLAADVHAPEDVPPHDYATMDGFAIAAGDTSPAVAAEIFPEDSPPELDDGEAARIATGAPLPARTDAVLKVENATVTNGRLSGPDLAPGTNVSPRGGTARADEVLFTNGARLAPRHAALLSDVGIDSIPVRERFSVAIVATGTEIHEGRQPDRDSAFLAGLLGEWGHEPTIRESVPDDSRTVRDAIESAAETHDAVLTTGGTSVGSADHVATVLEEHDPFFESVRLRPGRPVMAAVVDDALAIGLPGKPLAAHTAAVLVARPFFTGEQRLPSITMELAHPVGIPDDDREYAVPVVFCDGTAVPLGHTESALEIYDERFAPGLVAANTRATTADGIVLADDSLAAGEPVEVVPYRVLGMSEELRRITDEDVEAALSAQPVRDDTVLGVVLAAGGSSRFGVRNKLLAEIDGTPLVRHAARTLRDSRVSGVVAVLGHQSSAVRDALADLDVTLVKNDTHEEGLSTSVARGVREASERDAAAAVFLPGDMPLVDSTTVDSLADVFHADVADAVAPVYRDQRGNPVLFGARHFDALRSVGGDVGGRNVLLDSDGALFETDDEGVVTDIDTREDFERAQ